MVPKQPPLPACPTTTATSAGRKGKGGRAACVVAGEVGSWKEASGGSLAVVADLHFFDPAGAMARAT